MVEAISLEFDLSSLSRDPILRRLLGAGIEFSAVDMPDHVRRLAIRAWNDRARSEYVGVMIVRRFHGLLVDLNAPVDLQQLALQMLLEEQRHAAMCIAAAAALGGERTVAFDVVELQQARTGAPLEAQLIEQLVGTYACGEVVAFALLRHAIREVPASPFRDVLRRIAVDEVSHAYIGPTLLRAIRTGQEAGWIAWPGDDVVRAQVAFQQEWMRGRDVVEPDENEAFEDPQSAAALTAAGIPPSRAFKAAYLRAVERSIPKAMASVFEPPRRTLRLEGIATI